MANKKRFELDGNVIDGAAPRVTLTPSGSNFLLTINILIKGKNLPKPQPIPDPEEDTHRDIDLDMSNLFLGNHDVEFTAAPGTDAPVLKFTALIDGKIPGTLGAVPAPIIKP